MQILLTGGSANGKSGYAERLAAALPGPRLYIAAMQPCGPEGMAKIARHRQARAGLGFVTAERYGRLDQPPLPPGDTVLLECVCNLAANRLFASDGTMGDPGRVYREIMSELDALRAQRRHLLVITNDVGSDLGDYSRETRAYIALVGRINRALAARFGTVLELVCGIPIVRKGALPLPEPAGLPGEQERKQKQEQKEERQMLLIIGAAASGKRAYAQSLGYDLSELADGVLDGRRGLYHLQALVARDPEGAQALLPRLLEKEVILCDEVGSGIVPADPRARMIREQTGRLCTQLARRAGRVVRMVCGIPTVLKDTGREICAPGKKI